MPNWNYNSFSVYLLATAYDRVAQIHIPATYKADSKPPLVLLLHGGGGGAKHALEKDGWAAKSDKEGFLIVAPEGLGALPNLPTNFKINPALWNSGQLNARSPRAKIDDVAFIRELLDELKEKVPYDESRVFSTGHSNGGGMTFRLGAELSERLTAIGMVAGRMVIESPKPTKPLPTLYIIGNEDLLMPLKGGEVKSPWGSWLNPPVPEQLAHWAAAIGCEKEPKVISDQDDVRKVEYLSKTDGPTLTVIYINGQGHHWPGGKAVLPDRIMGPNTNKLNATDTIWEFFKSVPDTKQIRRLEDDIDRRHSAIYAVDPTSGRSYRDILAELIELEEQSSSPSINVVSVRLLFRDRSVSEVDEWPLCDRGSRQCVVRGWSRGDGAEKPAEAVRCAHSAAASDRNLLCSGRESERAVP